MGNEIQALEAITTDQPLSNDERALIEKVYARLRIWRDGCSEIHERARTARKILLLQDPGQDSPKTRPEKRALQLQTLKSTFNNCVADQIDNLMKAAMDPETPAFQEVVDDVNDVVQYIYEMNNKQALHRARVQDYLCTGTAITQILWDEDAQYGKGDITLLRVPVEAFLWDPSEASIQDARALFKVSWHPLSWYREHYPEKGIFVQSDEHTADAVGENKNQEELAGDDKKAMMLEYWERRYNPRTRKYSVDVAYVAGRALLYRRENVFAHGMYPFVLDVFTEIEGLPVGEGLVMELAPMMRLVNRYAQYMDANIRASSKTRMLVNRAANLDMSALEDWTRDIIEGDRIGPEAVNFMSSPPLSSLALNQMLQMQTDIKQDSGQNQFTRGETAGGVTAASAIDTLREAGSKQTRMRTQTLYHGTKAITDQILWLISQYYEPERMRMITGRDGAVREADVGAARLMGKKGARVPPPPYTVRIYVERQNPAVINSQNQLFIEAYKMAAQSGQPFPLSALFRLLNVDGKDKILPVIDEMEARNNQMQALAEQNEQLTQTVTAQQKSIDGLKDMVAERAVSTRDTSLSTSAIGFDI